jgi:hypothetical protein
MADLAELLMRYGYGQQDPGPDETYDTRNVLDTMQKRAPNLLNRLAGAIPENTEHGLSLANMLKGGLDTAGRWLGGNPEVGRDTLAPLGLAGVGAALAPRGAIGAMGGGRPAYHWSPKAGEISEANKFHPLSHFGTKEQANERYAKQLSADATDEWKAAHPEHGAVMPVELDIKNPLRVQDHYRHDPEVVAALIDWTRKHGGPDETSRRMVLLNEGPLRAAVNKASTPEDAARLIDAELQRTGHDGLVYRNAYEGGGDSYVATRPGTVRSAMTGSTLFADQQRASLPGILVNGLDKGGSQMSTDDVMRIYRGESAHNKKGGPYWTTDREWSRQFTHSGQDHEIKQSSVRRGDVYEPSQPVYAGDPDAIDKIVAEARSKGFKAVQLDEGAGQPPSIYVFNKTGLR